MKLDLSKLSGEDVAFIVTFGDSLARLGRLFDAMQKEKAASTKPRKLWGPR